MQTGRDVCIRIALFDEENPVIISPAYTTFQNQRYNLNYYLNFFCSSNREEAIDTAGSLVMGSIRSNLDWGAILRHRKPIA